MTTCVLDVSIALAWAFRDETSPYATSVIGRLRRDRAAAPGIWTIEVSNALIVAVRRGRIDEMNAYRIHRVIQDLPMEIDWDYTAATLGHRVLRLGIDHGLTAYDACYVDLAIRRGLPLATLDERLARAASKAGIEILQP